MNDEEAEGSCPNKKKAVILAWSHIRQNVEKVFTFTAQNTNVINLGNTKIKGQLTSGDRWKGWIEEGCPSVLICHSKKRGDSTQSGRTKTRGSNMLVKSTNGGLSLSLEIYGQEQWDDRRSR